MSCQPTISPIKGPPLQCSYCYGETDGTWDSLADHIQNCPALNATEAEVDAMREKNDPERAAWSRTRISQDRDAEETREAK